MKYKKEVPWEEINLKSSWRKNLLKLNRYTTTKYTAISFFLLILTLIPFLWAFNYTVPKTIGSYYTKNYFEVELLDENKQKFTSNETYLFLENFEFEESRFLYETELPSDTTILEVNTYCILNESETWKDPESKYIYEDSKLSIFTPIPNISFKPGDKLEIIVEYSFETKLEENERIIKSVEIISPLGEYFWQKMCIYRIIYPKYFEFTDIKIHPSSPSMGSSNYEKEEDVKIFVDFEMINNKKAITFYIFFLKPNVGIIPEVEFKNMFEPIEWDLLDIEYENLSVNLKISKEFFEIECETTIKNLSEEDMTYIPDPLFYFFNFEKYETYEAYIPLNCYNRQSLEIWDDPIPKNEKIYAKWFKNPQNEILIASNERKTLKINATVKHNLNLDARFIDTIPPFSFLALSNFMHVEFTIELPENSQIYSCIPVKEFKGNTITWDKNQIKQGDLSYYTVSFLNGAKIPKNLWLLGNFCFVFILLGYVIVTLFCFRTIYYTSSNSKVVGIMIGFLSVMLGMFIILAPSIPPQNVTFLQSYLDRLKCTSLYSLVIFAFFGALGVYLIKDKIRKIFGYLEKRSNELSFKLEVISEVLENNKELYISNIKNDHPKIDDDSIQAVVDEIKSEYLPKKYQEKNLIFIWGGKIKRKNFIREG